MGDFAKPQFPPLPAIACSVAWLPVRRTMFVPLEPSSTSRITATRPLALHWNGASWKIVPSPNVTPADSFLNGVTALSARDAWAVGIAGTVSTDMALTLIEHWDGHRWRIVGSPNVGMGNDILWAVARVPGTHKAWAVGSHSGPTYQILTEYNG